MKVKRILFVWSSAEFSTFDVARGFRRAIENHGGFSVRDYRLYARMRYHTKALGKRAENIDLLSRIASENIVVEAMKHRADLVFIISGLALHPDAIYYLRRVGIPTACLFTESPYNDPQQRTFNAVYPDMKCFTSERTSAVNGWRYLPHAFDPAIHKPVETETEQDVLMLGTLWQDRIKLLDTVDWTGIKARFIGTWCAPPAPEETKLKPLYDEGCVHNDTAPKYYGASRICLNIFRSHPTAESLNPRTYELAACKAFQLTDYRRELEDVFGVNGKCVIDTFTTEKLEDRIRYWLDHPNERRDHAEAAYQAVQPHTFDARLRTLLSSL